MCQTQVNHELLLTSVRLCSVKRDIFNFIFKSKHISSIQDIYYLKLNILFGIILKYSAKQYYQSNFLVLTFPHRPAV